MREGRLKRVADWTVRLGLPLAVLGMVMAVFFGEQMGIDHELSLLTPVSARRGVSLPVRTLVVTGLSDPEGPHLTGLPVRLSLRADDGRLLAETLLEASSAQSGAEGVIPIPADAPDSVVLRAIAEREGRGVASASRRFDLEAPTPPAPFEGRSAHAMQHLRQGALEEIDGQVPPSPFELRVVGGACVPEAPCTVLFHVGEPAARLRLPAHPSYTVREQPGGPTSGLTRFVLEIHGPEAHPVFEAVRDEVVVARRRVTLPVALATPVFELDARVLEPGSRPRLTTHVLGSPTLVVDLYHEGRWTWTGSLAAADSPAHLPPDTAGEGLEPGLWRLQIHTDPFSSARAASRVVTVGGSTDERWARLAALEGSDGVAPPPPGPDSLRFAWAASSLEVGHRALPAPVRGVEEDRAALEARQRTLRAVALVGMVLGLIVLTIVILRRGIRAAQVAQQVMEATGDPELTSPAHRRRTLLSAMAIVATLLLAFLAAGAMILARARLLE